MKIIAINLLVISSLFFPTAFFGHSGHSSRRKLFLWSFQIQSPSWRGGGKFHPNGDELDFPQGGRGLTRKIRWLHLQGDVQREFSSLRGLIFVTKTGQEFIHLAAESFFLDSRVGKEKCRFKWFKDFTKKKSTSNIFKQTCPFLLTIFMHRTFSDLQGASPCEDMLCLVRLMVMLSEEAVRASVPHTKARGTNLLSEKCCLQKFPPSRKCF